AGGRGDDGAAPGRRDERAGGDAERGAAEGAGDRGAVLTGVAMSEHDWVSAGNPFALVEMLHDRASERKRQLLACAVCRKLWRFLSGYEQAKDGIAVAESHADGLANAKALMQAHDRIAALRNRLSATRGSQYNYHHYQALDCVALACSPPTSQCVTLSREEDL